MPATRTRSRSSWPPAWSSPAAPAAPTRQRRHLRPARLHRLSGTRGKRRLGTGPGCRETRPGRTCTTSPSTVTGCSSAPTRASGPSSPGQPAEQVSEQAFDVMGFAQVGTTMHVLRAPRRRPGRPSGPGPADLHRRRPTSWNTISLEGQVDFHRLRAGGTVVQGLSAHDGKFLRSTDAGQTWTDLGTPPLFDFALDPNNPAAPDRNPADRTRPQHRRWHHPHAHPRRAPAGVPGLDRGHRVLHRRRRHRSRPPPTPVTTWTQVAQLRGPTPSPRRHGDHVVALAGTTIWESTDGGTTFTPRVTGIAGH